MDEITITISSTDGYAMNWKLEATEAEQDHLAETISEAVDTIKGRVRETP